MKNLLLIFLILLLSCDVENPFEEKLKAWVGKDYNVVISEWGHPTDIYPAPNGNEILYYVRIKSMTSPFPDFLDEEGNEREDSCQIFFEVGKDLLVLKYSYRGTYCWIDST